MTATETHYERGGLCYAGATWGEGSKKSRRKENKANLNWGKIQKGKLTSNQCQHDTNGNPQ